MDISKGFDLIDKSRCHFYKDGKDFILEAVKEYLSLKKAAPTSNVRHKITLIVGHTGVIFLLLSILRASIKDEKHKRHVLYNRKLVVKKGKLVLNENEKTIDTNELAKRLQGCGYEIKDIVGRVKKLSEARNDIIHHFSRKPEEELLSHITSIFFIVKDLVSNPKEFWGEFWDQLCELRDFTIKLENHCNTTYEKFDFIPNYYFNCIDCSSPFVSIEEVTASNNLYFKCQRCGSNKNKETLIQDLSLSSCFRDTHTIISFLTLFSNNLDDDAKSKIDIAARENDQVSRIIYDDDVFEFLYNVFGEDYFE